MSARVDLRAGMVDTGAMRPLALAPSLFGLAFACTPLLAGCDKGDEPPTQPPADAPSTAPAAETPTEPVAEIPPPEAVPREPIEPSEAATAIANAADRTEDDKETDARRYPAELLTFLEVQPGWKVADLGAGSGYTTELLARAVGKKGKVYAQNPPAWVERFLKESWPERLKRKVNAKVVRVDRSWEAPLPEDATQLDLVFFGFAYHDVVADGDDIEQLNRDVFEHLAPGGLYVVLDHHAPVQSGPEAAADLHRLDKQLVIEEIEEVGFELVDDNNFMRKPDDDRMSKSFDIGFDTDRYALKFRRPTE